MEHGKTPSTGITTKRVQTARKIVELFESADLLESAFEEDKATGEIKVNLIFKKEGMKK